MAKVTMLSGIASISGRVGNYCFRTMKSTGKVYMHSLPSKKRSPRPAAATTQAVLDHRERFARTAHMVAQMRKAGATLDRKKLWKLAEQAL